VEHSGIKLSTAYSHAEVVLEFSLALSVLFVVLLVACAPVLVTFCSGHSLSKEKQTVETAEIYDWVRMRTSKTFVSGKAQLKTKWNTLVCVYTIGGDRVKKGRER